MRYPNRAAEVAGDLILNEGVHIIMPTSTTDMVSNTMDQAELNNFDYPDEVPELGPLLPPDAIDLIGQPGPVEPQLQIVERRVRHVHSKGLHSLIRSRSVDDRELAPRG